MSLEICILASGSSGNCTLLRTRTGLMLIDAGLGPRMTQQRMKGTGCSLDDLAAICLTHLDADHFRPSWLRFAVQRKVRVYCSNRCVDELIQRVRDAFADDLDAPVEAFCDLVSGFATNPFSPLPDLSIRPVAFAHDAAGSHGFVIECNSSRIGYATDLGKVPDHLINCFQDLDILAMESNYDPGMQLASARPWFLKQRIMGGAGHLSNEQAFQAIQRIIEKAEQQQKRLPSHIVLLHRSRHCNCPIVMRKLFGRDPRIAQRLTFAEQYKRSDWLRPAQGKPHIGEQLSLSF
ncbi:MAG TPA: MBL fold metallo-hydrolase [Tepidisphaeraceae bacterium]|jgi:phosphoribosyl 1,2-cyclic phosphodiesterase